MLHSIIMLKVLNKFNFNAVQFELRYRVKYDVGNN